MKNFQKHMIEHLDRKGFRVLNFKRYMRKCLMQASQRGNYNIFEEKMLYISARYIRMQTYVKSGKKADKGIISRWIEFTKIMEK